MSRKPRRSPRPPKAAAPADPAARLKSRQANRLLLAALLVLCAGLTGTFYYAGEWLAERQVRNDGIPVPARIVTLGKTTKGKTPEYRMTVEFDAQGVGGGEPRTVRREFVVLEATYRGTNRDSQPIVRYLPEHPETARIDGEASEWPIRLIVATVATLAGSVLAWYAARRRSRLTAS